MKMKKVALIMASVLALASANAFADDAVKVSASGGTVHFKGELVNAACAVDAGSVEQTVQLGQYRTALLAKKGDVSDSVGFNIQLNDCDTSIAKTAKVAFSGVAVGADNPNVLALASSAGGTADNVGIQVIDSSGTPLKFDGATFSTATTLKDGVNILPFQARYYALGATTPGIANADANFLVQYE